MHASRFEPFPSMPRTRRTSRPRAPIAIALIALLAADVAQGQQAARAPYPIRSQPKLGGVYDVATGRRVGKTRARTVGASLQTVYDNTCTWSGGAFYLGLESCETVYDEGRVPLTADGGSGSQGATNAIDSFEIAYCTWFPTGSVDFDVALFDTNRLGGACVGSTPPIGAVGLFSFESSALGFPLPGSSALGVQQCWIVTLTTATPACLATGASTADLFNWSIRSNQQYAPSSPDGPLIAHNGSSGGQGTYDIPSA